MPQVHQHPDGFICVRTADGSYIDTLEHFAADYGQAFPALPDGAVQRLYEPGVRHPISGPDGVIAGGPLPWDFGDTVLAAFATLTAAKAARLAPPPPPPVDLHAYAASVRYQRETGGITVNGVPVATDDRSKLMITGARIAADADAGFTTQWKLATGAFTSIDAATVIAISNAVSDFVADCFAKEAELAAAITGGSITTTSQVDAAFATVSTAR
jgi:hypothetical protein